MIDGGENLSANIRAPAGEAIQTFAKSRVSAGSSAPPVGEVGSPVEGRPKAFGSEIGRLPCFADPPPKNSAGKYLSHFFVIFPLDSFAPIG